MKNRLAYVEIADTIDFVKLERDLFNESRNHWMTVLGAIIVAVCMFGIIFGFNLSDEAFLITIFSAIALITVFGFLGGHKALGLQHSIITYDAVIREEWRTGQRILPDWFHVPKGHRRLRTLPKPSDLPLRKMRLANLIDSGAFSIFVVMLFSLETIVAMVLAFKGFGALILGILLFITFVAILIPFICVIPSSRLLNELRDYEKVTGKIVLPDKLRKYDKK